MFGSTSALVHGRSFLPALGSFEDSCGDEGSCLVQHAFSSSAGKVGFFLVLVDYDVPNAGLAQCHGNGLVEVLLFHVAPWYARTFSAEDVILVFCQIVQSVGCH